MNAAVLEGDSLSMEQIGQRVQCRLSGLLSDFQVLRREDGLVLRGHARTYYAKQLAQHAVMEVVGSVPIVANEIEVG